MRLAEVVSVRADIGADDIQDINKAIAFSLDAATVGLEGKIGTAFDDGSYTNDFHIDSTLWFGGRPQRALRLTRGFLIGAPTLTYAGTFEALTTLPTTITTSNYVADLEAGLVNINGLDLSGQFVRVAYGAGFTVDPNEKDQFDPALVPDWLKTAARLQCRLGLNDQPFLTDGEEEATVKQVEDMLASIVASKARGFMDTLDPIVGV